MNIRLLLPIAVALALGLSACGKSEEPAEQQAAPDTSAVQEKAAMGEPAGAGEAAKPESAPPKEGN